MQDSPTPTPAKPWNAQLRALLLGANVWVIGVLWPLLGARPTSALELGLGCAAPLPLAWGASAFSARLGLGAFSWLVAFPALLAAAIAARPEALNRMLYGPFGLLLLGASLCAYGAAAIAALSPRAPELSALHRPLAEDPRDARARTNRHRERLLVGLCFAGAFVLCLAAPHAGGYDAIEAAFGDASESAAVLCAVVGGALAISLVAVYLGNGLRATPAPRARSERMRRAAFYLLLALFSAVTYFVVQP